MKHTPGPWFYTANDANGGMITDRRGTQVAWTLSGDPVENCANSCLIAAAPDLLAALESLVSACENEGFPHLGNILPAARRAISKSHGE